MNHIVAKISPRIQYIPFVIVVLSLLYRFFDRSVMFHDEIINLNKAERLWMFDYAKRPAFYGLSSLSIRFLGNDTLALPFVAYISFVVIAAYTYQYIKRDLGVLAATAGVTALAWSGLIYYIGIRGMPHLYPAAFFAAAIYHYHGTPVSQQGWGQRCLIAALLWLAMLFHPTGVALVLGFFGMVVLDVSLARNSLGTSAATRILLAWAMPMIALWGVVEALYYTFSTGHKSYVGYWLTGLGQTSSGVYKRYFEPFGFYFERLATLLLPLLIMAAALIVLLAWKAWRGRKGFEIFLSDDWRRVIGLLVVAIVSVLVISLEKWKFSRVLVTFMPIAILSMICLIFRVADSISWKRPLLFALLAGLVAIVSAVSFVGQARGIEAKFSRRYPAHSASFNIIRHLPVRDIGYIGRVQDSTDASNQIQGSGKALKMMTLSRKASGSKSAMARELMAAGNRYVIVSLAGDKDLIRTFHRLAYLNRFSRLTVFILRQRCELWELSPNYLGEDIETYLGTLSKDARLGLLLDGKHDVWLKWTLDDKKFASKWLRDVPDARSAKKYSFIFLSTSSGNAKTSRTALVSFGMRKVGEISAIDGGNNLIEMWGSHD